MLTGMPRHDRLWSMRKSATSLLVLPTWRKYLLDKKYQPIASFADSDYVKHWRSVLQSTMLRNLAEQYGLRVVFCPHAAVAPFIEVFAPPDYVEVVDQPAQPGLHRSLPRPRSVTDYSSVAFDMAYIERPVINYQFDIARFTRGINRVPGTWILEGWIRPDLRDRGRLYSAA